MIAAHPALAPLSSGFRGRYLTYDDLTAQLRAWADAFPAIVRLGSIGATPEGRELWLLTIGPEPDRARPAVWVDGNMHAGEIAGSSVALAIAEEAIALHLGSPPDAQALPSRVRDAARDALFYVLPRMSPDGAEAMFQTGRYVRSVPRDGRPARSEPRWISRDVDGDGQALLMRSIDETGEFVEHPELPGVMLGRTVEDEGPFYKLYPEGHVEPWEARRIPTPDFLGDNSPDLNRNFPWEWKGEPAQKGAGDHPGSEPEARAVIEHAAAHPNLFVWLNLHTFGGVLIRPPGDHPDSKMEQRDLALYRQVEQWAHELCGYPMVSGFEEFRYTPSEPVRGSLSEWAYVERGCLAWVTELWDIFARIGMERPKRFIDYYFRMSKADVEALARWDAAENEARIFRPWRAFEHPQLGPVEIGGVDARVGLQNPPPSELPRICEEQSHIFLRAAALIPRVRIADVLVVAEGAHRSIELSIENHGYLPTHGVFASVAHPFNEPLWLDVRCEGGAELLHTDEAHREVGHLEGWGRGRFDFGHAIFFQRSKGDVSRRRMRVAVRGAGDVTLRVGSCRVGWVEQRITL